MMKSTYIIYIDNPYYQLLCCNIHTSSPMMVVYLTWLFSNSSDVLIVYCYYIIHVTK